MSGLFPAAPDWAELAALELLSPATLVADDCVELNTSCGLLHLQIFDQGVRLRSTKARDYDYGLLVSEPKYEPLKVSGNTEQSVVESQHYSLLIEHKPFYFELKHNQRLVQRSPSDGHFVRRFRIPPLSQVENGWMMSFELQSGEPVYGLGEKWGKLDKRGQLIRSYNHDALGVNAEISYKNAPFAWSPEGWGVFVHTPAPVTHAVGYAPWSQRSYALIIEDDSLDIFIMAGDSGAELIQTYTALTGRAPVPPLWSAGAILSKAYYRDAPEIIAAAREVRKRGMPCDLITFDGRAWQDTDTRFAFEWDSSRYPDPEAVIAELKALDFKICVWEYPLISTQHPWFDEFSEKGWLLKDRRTGEAYRYQWDMQAFGPVLTPLPDSGIVDFTHPDAYNFWRDSHKPLFDLGVDMIKADFGEQVEDDNMLAYSGDSGHALHNVYSHLYNRCVYEAASNYCQSGPFLFSRSSWIGCQRYPSQWGGDPQADWGGMAANIRGGISWGMTGAPFYATDIGGFYKDVRDDILYVRWAQAGVFSAHMRLHGIGPREPWSYNSEAEEAVLAALKLRYRLLPYLLQIFEQASQTGLPVQRAMALAWPDDKASWSFEDQFMFGEHMLVAPCLKSSGKVDVYLPEGEWYRFPDQKQFSGGRVHALQLAIEEMAVFVRAGVAIPLGPELQHTGELSDAGAVVSEHWIAGA